MSPSALSDAHKISLRLIDILLLCTKLNEFPLEKNCIRYIPTERVYHENRYLSMMGGNIRNNGEAYLKLNKLFPLMGIQYF